MHSYRSLSRADQKKAARKPDGRIARGHTIRWGDVYRGETTLTHNTCFIPRATLVTSLWPSCETRPHAEIRSLFSGLTQWLLQEKERIMTLVSWLGIFRHQMNRSRSRRCFWKSQCCSSFVLIIQNCCYKRRESGDKLFNLYAQMNV